MAGDYQYVDPELLEMGREELAVRLLDVPDDVARRVIRQRTDPDLHGWLSEEFLRLGDSDVRYVRLLLSILPELWLRDQEGARTTLWELLDSDVRPETTVTMAREWALKVLEGEFDDRYSNLSTSSLMQE